MHPPARSLGSACWPRGRPNSSSDWQNPRAALTRLALLRCPRRVPAARAFPTIPAISACCSWLHRHELLVVDARDVDARGFELLQLVAQRARTDPQALRGELAIAAGDAQRRQDQFALAILQVAIQAGVLRCGRSSATGRS